MDASSEPHPALPDAARPWRSGWLSALRDLLLPPACGICGRAGVDPREPLCRPCARTLAPPPALPPPPEVDALWAAAAYGGPMAGWVLRAKAPERASQALSTPALAALAGLLQGLARRLPGPAPDRILPVPLHPSRLRARGFSPPALLAAAVRRARPARLDPARLVRLRPTRSQTLLSLEARRRNVAGAFACRRPVHGRIWLVDDVVTTGATVSACAEALRRAGAREVEVLCVARTPPGDLSGGGARSPRSLR